MTNDGGFNPHVVPRYPNQFVRTSETVYKAYFLVDRETGARIQQFRELHGIKLTELVRRAVAVVKMFHWCHAVRVRKVGVDVGHQIDIHPEPYEFEYTAIDAVVNIHTSVHTELQRLLEACPGLTVSQLLRHGIRLYTDLHGYIESGWWIGEMKWLSITDWESFDLLTKSG